MKTELVRKFGEIYLVQCYGWQVMILSTYVFKLLDDISAVVKLLKPSQTENLGFVCINL